MGNSSAGIGALVFFIILASHIITWVTGCYSHWLFIVPGIFMGLLAAGSIR